ncbi:hypothetical protein JCM39194_10320 [Desulfotomaculum varum]
MGDIKGTEPQVAMSEICAACGDVVPEKLIYPKGERNLCKLCWEYEKIVDVINKKKPKL